MTKRSRKNLRAAADTLGEMAEKDRKKGEREETITWTIPRVCCTLVAKVNEANWFRAELDEPAQAILKAKVAAILDAATQQLKELIAKTAEEAQDE